MKFYKRIRGEQDEVDAVINYLPWLIILQMKVGTFIDSYTAKLRTAFITLDIIYTNKKLKFRIGKYII